MDPRARALQELPTALAVALRLRDAGEVDAVVAEALGIEPEGVPELLEIAEQKLAQAQRRVRSGRSGDPASKPPP